MRPTVIDHAAIAARIPHAGAMCLLDAVLAWSTHDIRCRIVNHADERHPLRGAGGLLAPNAIEYAAQAMALHGSLCQPPGHTPRPGFLASARGVTLHVPRLDNRPGPLTVSAMRLAGDGRQALYRFELRDAADHVLVDGRATVVLDRPLVPEADPP